MIYEIRWRVAYHLGRLAWWVMPEPDRTMELTKWRSRLSAQEFAERLAERGMRLPETWK